MLRLSIFILLLLPCVYNYSLCINSFSTNCLPCAYECNACTNQSTCSSCDIQYYQYINTTTLCSNCPENCQSCSSSTTCTLCLNPYVLVNSSCSLCVISNAISCSSSVSALSCKSGYYLSNSYCNKCLLNCATCSSAYDCSACGNGFYLNTSIITCNTCPLGCKTCNQFTPTTCTSCNNGYLLSNFNCSLINCTFTNCQYCSSAVVCQQCSSFYYWNGSQCVNGGSISCENGSNGPLPNNCINQCSSFGYISNNSTSNFQCKLYSSVYVSSVEYHQTYYYAYNYVDELNFLTGTSATLVLQTNGQYSYPLSSSFNFTSLLSYYRISVAIKYTSASNCALLLSTTTPTSVYQNETHIIQASSSPVGTLFSSTVVHSNSLIITPNTTVNIVQIWLRIYKCSSGCTICLNQQLCQLCNSPNFMLSYNCVANCTVYIHFVPNMTCLTACPNNYFQTTSSGLKYCTSCVSPCLDCLNSSFCVSCRSGYYYYNYACQSACPHDYYSDKSSNSCKSCINPCKTCINQTTCLSCSQGFWNGSSCINSCASGYFGDTINFICSTCDLTCLTCINSATTCTSCNSTLIYYNMQCLISCPSRYYNSNSTCFVCLPPCYTCTSTSSCLSCSYNYLYNVSCIGNCPNGYFQNQAQLRCSACQSVCLTCTSSSLCTACKTGCLYSGNCLPNCSNSHFFSQISNTTGCSCIKCIYPCSTCSNQNYCLSCLDGYLFNGSCLVECPSSYYTNSINSTCTPCMNTFNNCLSCLSTSCKLCVNGYYLLSGQCTSLCPQYYYASNQQCLSCVAPCKTCSSTSTCSSCISPYILNGNSCVIQCPSSDIGLTINNILQCVLCTSPCLSCSMSTTNCTYCVYGYFLYNYICTSNCSSISPSYSHYAQTSTLRCDLCTFPCLKCLSATACLSCRIGYLNPSTSTCNQCSLGTYPVNSTCINCPIACAICYSSSFCTACNSAYYLFNNSCISNTTICQVNGYYVSGQTCYPCLQPCLTCWITSSNCTTCLSGYIFYIPNSCLISCPNGFYRNSNNCAACQAQCATCVSLSYYCLTCTSGYYLFLSNASCASQCPQKTYLSGSVCSSCQYPCLTCSSQVSCLSCISGVLVGTQCYSSCLSGYFADDTMVCQSCTSPCDQCLSSSINCTQCINGYWLMNSTCISNCPSQYFPQSQSSQCLKCVGLCFQCSSYVNCTSCNSSYIYIFSKVNMIGQCVSSCPATYYLANNSCAQCNSKCLTCVNGYSCLTCSGSLVQNSGTCLSQCPAGMYSLGGICSNCSLPCSNCTDAYTCTSCPNTYLLVASSSCVPGPTCPSGYYLSALAARCDSKCASGYYNLKNGTCNNVSCGNDYFMGADMFCYSSCPTGYLGNETFYCVTCTNCEDGLFFSLSSSIIKDSLYLYLSFTQPPIYQLTPSLSFSPALPYQSINFAQDTLVGGGVNYTGQKNLTFLIPVTYSLQPFSLTVKFNQPLQTFYNPLQVSSVDLLIEGYDYYPPNLTSLSSFGIAALFCALIGLGKNPFMIDFAQNLFFMGLVACHYPSNLASFLQSTSIAHFHGIIGLSQPDSLGQGKFMYLTGIGFLTNTVTNWIIIALFITISLIIYLLIWILQNRKNYNKINVQNNQQIIISESSKGHPSCLLTKLQALVVNYKFRWLNRVLYFNYAIISLFTLTQLANFNTSPLINTAASISSILALLLILYYPLTLRQAKPKYAFLYVRKLLISGAVVLSVQDAIYAVGIIFVCNLTAAILILTYKLQKYRFQTRFLAACELAQVLIFGTLSFFIMIGEGNATKGKLILCWVIAIMLITMLFVYIIQALIELGIHLYLLFKNVNLKENWILNQNEDEMESHHSESISPSMKDQKPQKINEPHSKTGQNLQTLLVQVKQQMKQRITSKIIKQQTHSHFKQKRNDQKVFWAYSDSDKDENENNLAPVVAQKQPPHMLVRCINEFSDFQNRSQKPN